ncbi:hypothetical protein JKF63_07476 [Porcisia hertigi]|uniref:Uncharacterized protein n=1 Tax=Porcisia hertigi TaxID=2761500 RepID=A0A836IX92_9TRYP|nr:hypothetical protein JKF63_07476 [Porcisia hertigi]
MVHVRLITPALAQLLDEAASDPAAERVLRDFVEERLCALVHTQSPSQLESALWIYLVAHQQLLSRAAHDSQPPDQELGAHGGVPESRTTSCNSSAPLPPSLQLPECLTCISDAVRWYCGELSMPVASHPIADASHPASRPRQGTQQQHPRPKAVPHMKQEPRASPETQPGALIDELLRYRQQPAPSSAPPQGAQHLKQESGPLATVQLAIDALAQVKYASVLLQPHTILLLVRNLVSLWSLIYLCKQLKRHQLRKERLLTGTGVTSAGTIEVKRVCGENRRRRDSIRSDRKPNQHHAGSEPIAVCFHDYDLLVPWDLVQRVLSPSAVSMKHVAARCRAIETRAGTLPLTSSGSSDTPSDFALILNPAVTALGDNPDRLRKNARIDAIEKAASQYHYALLSSRAHGQTSGDNRSLSAGASAASAAAHQEALRGSLTAVDIGEYGVLDPSRLRGPSSLADVDGPPSGGVGRGPLANLEANAKSYALFLRDASIGFDIQVMALTGAGVGYYLAYLRGLSPEWCTLYAVVGLVAMMLVDAVLLMIRVGRQDEAMRKARRRIRWQREKLEKEGERIVQTMQASAGLFAAGGTEPTTTTTTTGNETEGGSKKDVKEAAAAPPPPRLIDLLTKKKQ